MVWQDSPTSPAWVLPRKAADKASDHNFYILPKNTSQAANTSSCWFHHSTIAPNTFIASTDMSSSANSRVTSCRANRNSSCTKGFHERGSSDGNCVDLPE